MAELASPPVFRFACHDRDAVAAAVDRLLADGGCPRLLGWGEPLHRDGWWLALRNQCFQHLVERHGFRAIAIESSYPRGTLINRYVGGIVSLTWSQLAEAGFSHGVGAYLHNRDLVEWIRSRNAVSHPADAVHFYGFDSPAEMMYTESPRQLLLVAIEYLQRVDAGRGEWYRQRVQRLLGDDAGWANPLAMFEPAQAIGRSEAAAELRVVTEDLIQELRSNGLRFMASTSSHDHAAALQHARQGRQLLSYHAELATESADRTAQLLGHRDAAMADNLAYIARCEADRGGVFVFGHNSHLRMGPAHWQLGPQLLEWWPAGAHARHWFGDAYRTVGLGIYSSASDGIEPADAATLEHWLAADMGAGLVPTRCGARFPEVRERSGSRTAPGYFPLDAAARDDFDWLLVGSE